MVESIGLKRKRRRENPERGNKVEEESFLRARREVRKTKNGRQT